MDLRSRSPKVSFAVLDRVCVCPSVHSGLSLFLHSDNVQYHGKSILIQMPGLDVLEVQFYLQGHLLLIGNQEMAEVEQHCARFPAGYDGQIHPHIGLCLRSADPGMFRACLYTQTN
jgi:hypothetical protein